MAALLPEHVNKWESALHMDGYYVVGVIVMPYPGFSCIITIISKGRGLTLYALRITPNALALTLQRCHQWQWGRGVHGFPTYICIMCLGICARLTMPLTSLFTHPHSTTTRWCIFLSLQVLQNKLSAIKTCDSEGHGNIVFIYMFALWKCSTPWCWICYGCSPQ